VARTPLFTTKLSGVRLETSSYDLSAAEGDAWLATHVDEPIPLLREVKGGDRAECLADLALELGSAGSTQGNHHGDQLALDLLLI
jgi:hypothetical protein